MSRLHGIPTARDRRRERAAGIALARRDASITLQPSAP
jgi:hypothetical protein